MCGLLVTCLVTWIYLASAESVISCIEGLEAVRNVTQNESTWDVHADIQASTCSWRLETASLDRVVVIRPSGDPSEALGCEHLSVQYSPARSERLCGEFWSSESYVIISFTPPAGTTSFHFNITYYAKKQDDYSSQTTFSVYPSPSILWILTSPTLDENSPSNTDFPSLNWLLKADDLVCIDLQVLDQPTLRGLIHVHDGDGVSSPELGVCGSSNPSSITGTRNAMFIRTDPSINSTSNHGFWLSFKSTYNCNGDVIVLHARSQIQEIVSPNISETVHEYPTNIKCRWLIQSDDRRYAVKLETAESHLQSTYRCVNDSIAAFDYKTGELIRRWCGQTDPSLVSSDSAMLLEFTSDMSVVQSGFRLEYSRMEKVTCGSTYFNAPTTGYRRVFESPGYPSYYPNNMHCEWEVESDSAYYGIRLELTSVNLERTSDGQCLDYLQVIGEASPSSKMCTPAHTGTTFEASHFALRVVFHSNSNTTYPGFKITYYSFPKSTNDFGCKATLNASETTQVLFSPAYPHNYPNNLHCSWVFQSRKADSIVVIEVVDSEMQAAPTNDGRCSADYGVAYDGPDNTYPEMGRWCGRTNPTFRSRGQFMNLVFITDTSRRFRGFQLKYYTMKDFKFCPYKRVMKLAATTRIKYFNSPNYPDGYPSNIDCRWLISAPNISMVVKVIVVETDMEKSNVCSFDVVRVYDGKSASFDVEEVGYFCGTSTPQYKSTQQHMFLEFKSDASTNKRGFKIMYQAIRLTEIKNTSIVGIIVGGILGGVAVIAAVATITVLIARRHRQGHARQENNTPRPRGESIVVNLNRTDNTVFFMSPVYFTDSTDHLELGAPPPYPGLPNEGFLSDHQQPYALNDLPPPYTEIDSNTSLISDVMNVSVSTSPDPYGDISTARPPERESSTGTLRSITEIEPTSSILESPSERGLLASTPRSPPTERELSFSTVNNPPGSSFRNSTGELSFSNLRNPSFSNLRNPSGSTFRSPTEGQLSFSNVRSRSERDLTERNLSFSTLRSQSERNLTDSAFTCPTEGALSFSTLRSPPESESPSSRPVVYRERIRPSRRKPNRNSIETSV